MIYLTVICNSGGNHGHQLKDMLGGITIAKLFGFTYAHTSYDYLEFFGMGDGEIDVKDLDKNIERIIIKGPEWKGISHKKAVEIFGGLKEKFRNKECLIVLENAMRIHPYQTIRWYDDGIISSNVFEEVVGAISAKFNLKHQDRKTYFNKNKINITIHISRGVDFNDPKNHLNPNFAHYMFPIEYYSNIVSILQEKIKKECEIHVYTEKLNSKEVADTFKGKKNLILHIGPNRRTRLNKFFYGHFGVTEEIHDIFYHMVRSDILVTSNSGFSVAAGYFRFPRPTIYHPHTHYFDLPEDKYIATDVDGNFDTHFLGVL